MIVIFVFGFPSNVCKPTLFLYSCKLSKYIIQAVYFPLVLELLPLNKHMYNILVEVL